VRKSYGESLKTRIASRFEEEYAGRVQKPSDCFPALMKEFGCSKGTLYAINPLLKALNAAARSRPAEEVAEVPSEIGEAEVAIPSDLSEKGRQCVTQYINANASLSSRVQFQQSQIESLQAALARKDKANVALKAASVQLMGAL
jgi:hypothetical protein